MMLGRRLFFCEPDLPSFARQLEDVSECIRDCLGAISRSIGEKLGVIAMALDIAMTGAQDYRSKVYPKAAQIFQT